MRCVLSIGVLALLATTLVVAYNSDSIVFPEDTESKPRITAPAQTRNNTMLAALGRSSLEAATSSVNAFSRKFFKEVAKEKSGNLIFSPIGTWLVMSMMSYGAVGDTSLDMRRALELPQNDYLAKIGIRLLVDKLSSWSEVELKVANKIFLNYGMTPKPDFMHIVRNVFRSEVESIDMFDPETASSTVNKWCTDITNKRINDIVNPDDFSGPPLVLLLNAVYFKGSWSQPFDPRSTSESFFHVNAYEKKKITSMAVSGVFRYGTLRELDSSYVELPYKSDDDKHNASMFVILPSRRDGLADLEAAFDTVKIEDLIEHGEMTNVNVVLPKFKIESKIELVEPLRGFGMSRVFQSPDFSGIVDRPRIFVDKIVQKAFIEVDEFGSEAAAVTESSIQWKILSESFNADHPFMVVVATTSETPVTLFTARYTGPS